jgi:hypothetical protein
MGPKEREKVKAQERKDISIRNSVEGEFGTGKRKYGLSLIMTKLPNMSETVIALNFFTIKSGKEASASFAPNFYSDIFWQN